MRYVRGEGKRIDRSTRKFQGEENVFKNGRVDGAVFG